MRTFINDANGRVLEKATQQAAPLIANPNNNQTGTYTLGQLPRNTNGAATNAVNGNILNGQISQTGYNNEVTRVLIANNEVMGETGNNLLEQVSNFNAAYRQIDANYPSAAPSNYTVMRGDTLISIARSVWGDSSLWYLIAEANALGSPDSITEGMTLTIPNRVTNINNNASTFAPYDPSRIIGDITPTVPAPPPPSPDSGRCGGFGQVIVAIVAIAVTVVVSTYLGGEAGLTVGQAILAAAAGNVAAQATANMGI